MIVRVTNRREWIFCVVYIAHNFRVLVVIECGPRDKEICVVWSVFMSIFSVRFVVIEEIY